MISQNNTTSNHLQASIGSWGYLYRGAWDWPRENGSPCGRIWERGRGTHEGAETSFGPTLCHEPQESAINGLAVLFFVYVLYTCVVHFTDLNYFEYPTYIILFLYFGGEVCRCIMYVAMECSIIQCLFV